MSILSNLFRRDALPAPAAGDDVLRAALEETAAPGEDVSYRRLMGVIAEDLRLRQPAPAHRSWAWVPAVSMAAAAAVIVVLAYDFGVHRGQEMERMARLNQPSAVATVPPVPLGQYRVPPGAAPSVAVPGKPAVKPKPEPVERPTGGDTVLAPLLGFGLNAEQRDLVAEVSAAMDERDWGTAVSLLVRVADGDPKTETAVSALHAAAMVEQQYGDDAESARALFQREAETCRAMLESETDPVTVAWLNERLSAAEAASGATAQPQQPTENPQ